MWPIIPIYELDMIVFNWISPEAETMDEFGSSILGGNPREAWDVCREREKPIKIMLITHSLHDLQCEL